VKKLKKEMEFMKRFVQGIVYSIGYIFTILFLGGKAYSDKDQLTTIATTWPKFI
jgi:hypothetical protein